MADRSLFTRSRADVGASVIWLEIFRSAKRFLRQREVLERL